MIKLIKEIYQIKKHSSSEFYYLMFVCMLWGHLTVNFGMVFFSKIFGGSSVDLLIIVIEIILALLSTGYWLNRIRLGDIVFASLCIAFYSLSYFADPKISNIIVEKYIYFLTALVYYFVGVTINLDKYKNILHFVSIANILSSSIYYFLLSKSLGSNADDLGDHNMVAAYNILPSVIYVIWHLISTFNRSNVCTYINVLATILGVLLIFSFGTRGALVCLLFFIVVYVFFIAKVKHKLLIKTIVLLAGLFVYYYLDTILLYMVGLTESLGMSSRIFTTLIDGTFLNGEASTNERVVLLDTIKDIIDRDSSIVIFGKGVFGWAKYIYVYPHDFYYEMVITFGYFFSYFLMTVLVYILSKAFVSNQIDSNKAFLLLTVSVGLVKLFMSGSFVDEYYFYLMIGFAINMITRMKVNVLTN